MVVKIVRMRLMEPLSWGRVKWQSVMGTGVLYLLLLLLSTSLGQDTEGKEGLSVSPPTSLLRLFVLFFLLSLSFISVS